MPEWTEIATLDSGTTDFGAVVQIDGNYLITSDNNNVYIYEKTTKGNKMGTKLHSLEYVCRDRTQMFL